jgi:thiol-disulfide isomerase/thioredoxin
MDILTAGALIIGLIVVATAIGAVWRSRTGRVRARSGQVRVTPSEVGAAATAFGTKATLLQFSTEYCAPCRATARVLDAIGSASEGVEHVEIDLTDRPDLARRFSVLQTPTTLVLDGEGTVRARIGGAARPAEVRVAIDDLLRSTHVRTV